MGFLETIRKNMKISILVIVFIIFSGCSIKKETTKTVNCEPLLFQKPEFPKYTPADSPFVWGILLNGAVLTEGARAPVAIWIDSGLYGKCGITAEAYLKHGRVRLDFDENMECPLDNGSYVSYKLKSVNEYGPDGKSGFQLGSFRKNTHFNLYFGKVERF